MPAYTWATGETITAAKLNALETEAYRVANLIGYDEIVGSTFSTSSTSLVDITNLSVTFTAQSTSVIIFIHALCGSSATVGASAEAGGAIGVRVNSVDYEIAGVNWVITSNNGYWGFPLAGFVKVTGLTANTSYTAQGRARRGFGQSTGNFIVGGTNGAENVMMGLSVFDIVK